jgi:glycosyltransferase involved in cell wall biosynthesis
MTSPLVTVVVPALNEESDIQECIRALKAQDYPHNRIEVIVVDGESSDATAQVAEGSLATADFHRALVLANSKRTTPSNLNLGLQSSTGEIVCRIDARCRVPPHYLTQCVAILNRRPDVAVVGGAQVAEAGPNSSTMERAIARALNNPYAMGLSRYRRGAGSGPGDTVYLGSFRTDQLLRAGGWDERFLTNQDYELNRRMSRIGLVWFDSELRVRYQPRRSLRALARQYRRFGRWKLAVWLEGGTAIAPRQIALVITPLLCSALAPALLRRSPRLTAGLVVVGAALVDRSARRSAPVGERVAALGANALVICSWYSGILEQLARHVVGQRLLSAGPSRLPSAQREI